MFELKGKSVLYRVGIPPFSEIGFLPEGVFSTTFYELQDRFVTGLNRKNLWIRLTAFLQEHVSPNVFSDLYFGGDFLSSNPEPVQLDLILQTKEPFGIKAFGAMKPFFELGLNQIRDEYNIHLHFWSNGFPGKITDLREFFQYATVEDTLSLDRSQKRGIVRVELDHQSIKKLR